MQALSTKRGTSTPMWLGLWVMLKYRTKNNYCNGLYLFGRLFDKAVFTFLTATFYLWVGKNNTAANVPNLGGLLFLWCAWSLQDIHRHASEQLACVQADGRLRCNSIRH